MNPFTKAHIRLDRNLTVLIATGMVCATVLLFATFVWPTPYTYQNDEHSFIVRINRLTGSAIIVWPVAESPKSTDNKSLTSTASRRANRYTDDELLQWYASVTGKRDDTIPPTSTEKSSYLAFILGIGCAGIIMAVVVWYRGIGPINYCFSKATVAIAATFREIKPKIVDVCAIQAISRRYDVCRNGNAEQGHPFPVPQTAKEYGGIHRLAYWLGFIGILVMNQVFNLMTRGNPIAALFGFAIIITLAFVLMVNRLRNIGMSEWWSLLILVPLGNLFLGVECGIYPEGYSDTKRLDLAGRILTWITFGCLAVVISAVCIMLLELVHYESFHL